MCSVDFGIFAFNYHLKFDYLQLVEEYNLLPLLQQLLTPGAAEDDLFLEAVIMVRNLLFVLLQLHDSVTREVWV